MLIVPGSCWLYRVFLALGRQGIYSACTRVTRQHASLCPQCGLPVAYIVIPYGRCLQKPSSRQRLITVSDYAPLLSGLIHQLKFSRRSETALALSRLLLLEVLQARHVCYLPLPDRLISVPLRQRRHRRRGFNQSDLLCRPLARWLGYDWNGWTIS